MYNIESKKISVFLILISIVGIFAGYVIRYPFSDYLYTYQLNYQQNISPPVYVYCVRILGIEFSFINFYLMMFSLLGIGIYWFIFKSDKGIKESYQVFKNKVVEKYSSIKSKRFRTPEMINIFSWLILLGIIAILFYFGASYFTFINNKITRKIPLSLFEAFYSSYFFVFPIIAGIVILRKMLK